ncbi:hypothetical protein MMC30_001015, partial [Trapelia coarctata]|nr:hypothetical protein [Trapelia coarctata]
KKLYDAAKTYPYLTFQAVINLYNGPGDSCPNIDYASAVNNLHSYPNIQTLGCVHTASRYDCGSSGTDIYSATQPISDVEANIAAWQNWSKCSTTQDLHMDGIFFDEAPAVPGNTSYMNTSATFTKSTLTKGPKTTLFNACTAVDSGYWAVADYINILEDTKKAYYAVDIGALDGDGLYSQQTTMIIHTCAGAASTVYGDVNTIVSYNNDAIAGLFITSINPTRADSYGTFSTLWTSFTATMGNVTKANAGRLGTAVRVRVGIARGHGDKERCCELEIWASVELNTKTRIMQNEICGAIGASKIYFSHQAHMLHSGASDLYTECQSLDLL